MTRKTGTSRADLLVGTSSNDQLYGLAGNDALLGGAGRDTLDGGTGDDILNGGSGNDWLVSGTGDDVLIGGSGNDDMFGSIGSSGTFFAGSGDDFVGMHADSDLVVHGDSGIDHVRIDLALSSSPHADRIFVANVFGSHATLSGAGHVTEFRDVEHFNIDFGRSNGNLVLAGSGARSVIFNAGDGNNTLTGSTGHDRLTSGNGNNALRGGAGDDILVSGAGDDLVIGDDGNDQIHASTGINQIYADNGDDWVIAALAQENQIETGSGADQFWLSYAIGENPLLANDPARSPNTSQATVDLGTGDDVATLRLPGNGNAHAVNLDGGAGFDRVSIEMSAAIASFTLVPSDSIELGAVRLRNVEQVDVMTGTGNDHLTGGSGSDTLIAGTGRDIVKGEGGDDIVGISEGGTADGGAGTDTVQLSMSSAVSFVFVSALQVDATTSFSNMERLAFRGGSGNDNVSGGSLDDSLADGAGNDVMRGGAGNDEFVRGVGLGTSGIDLLDGGTGHDTLRFASYRDSPAFGIEQDAWDEGAKVDLVNQDRNSGEAAGLTVHHVETIIGTFNADEFRGGSTDETFVGGNGRDVLSGRGGDDYLNGGFDADVLRGGSGRDTFRLDSQEGSDRILDFTRGVDKIEIDRFPTSGAGTELVVGIKPFASTNTAQLLFDTRKHQLWFDHDGSGSAEAQLVATLDGVTTLSNSDFAFV